VTQHIESVKYPEQNDDYEEDDGVTLIRVATTALPDPKVHPPKFEGVAVIGYLKAGIKHNNKGDMEFTITVPYRYRHNGIPLVDAIGKPLLLEIREYKPYE